MVNLDKYSSIFIANWKLNGNSSFLKDYYEKLKVNSNNCTIICSPSIYLKSLKGNNENLFCGAQDVSSFKEGAYTGELSASMLKDNNIDFCLVGHSERRQYFAETNEYLKFDREKSNGMRLDIPSGTAVRFEPGQSKDVELIPITGNRKIFGFNKKVMGQL